MVNTKLSVMIISAMTCRKPVIVTAFSEIQIRGSTEDNSKDNFFVFPNENIGCGPSLEPS